LWWLNTASKSPFNSDAYYGVSCENNKNQNMKNFTFMKKTHLSYLCLLFFCLLISTFNVSGQNCSVNAGIDDSICTEKELLPFCQKDYLSNQIFLYKREFKIKQITIVNYKAL